DGQRILFTTQGAQVDGGIDGSVCTTTLDASGTIDCIGPPQGKSQGIIDLPEYGRILVMQWGIETPRGSRGAVIFEVPRDGKLAILAEHWFDEMIGEGFYEPRNSMLFMY